MRAKYEALTVCYLIKDDKVLFIKFEKKWGQKYSPPGGKVDSKETPLQGIIREFKEETGLTLINPKLKGIAHWLDTTEGLNFVYICNEYKGELTENSIEGKVEWIPIKEIDGLEQFQMNKIFNKYVFEDGLFEGDFLLDENKDVINYSIKKI